MPFIGTARQIIGLFLYVIFGYFAWQMVLKVLSVNKEQ